jgi:hypothetical protein
MYQEYLNRPYNDYPYLILLNFPYRFKLGTNFSLRAFVYQKTNLFGDPLPLELAGLSIRLNIFNSDNILINSLPVIISDINRSEIECLINKNSILNSGIYYAEFIFKDIDDTTFILPIRDKIQLVVF